MSKFNHDHSKIHKKYLTLKEDNTLVFVLDGDFYRTFDDDAKIASDILGYKIFNNMVGFPKTSITKVIDKLDDALVNYHFTDNDLKFSISENNNQYNNYLNIIRKTEAIKDKLDNLNSRVKELVLNDINNYDKILKLLGDLNG